jgi:hypothetical protein
MVQSQKSSSPSIFVIGLLGLITAVLAALGLYSVFGSSSITANNTTRNLDGSITNQDWTLYYYDGRGDLAGNFDRAVSASTGIVYHDTSEFPDLPDPNMDPGCKQVSDLTDAPCKWEISTRTSTSGDPVIEVKLVSDRFLISEGQVMEDNVSYLTSSQFTELEGMSRGWMGYIRTATWLEKMGFGKLTWQATDIVLRTLVGRQVVRVVADKVGWFGNINTSLSLGAKNIASNIYYYVVK